MIKRLFMLLFIQLWTNALTQHSPFSLQTAVEALHKHEEQLALNKNNYNNNLNKIQDRYGPSSDDNYYWDSESDLSYPHAGRVNVNQILAKQLAKERNSDIKNLNNENYLQAIDEKKRSFFRERDEKYNDASIYPTVFRERELEPLKQSELAEAFLREIQNEKELKREHRYRDTLRDLWENYQQQENQIKQDLLNLNSFNSYDGDNNDYDIDDNDKRKLSNFDLFNINDNKNNNDLNTYYNGPSMDRKRSYPVLPWLPASKKKRFSVTKRSPKPKQNDNNQIGTDEKVAEDLQAIFGQSKQEKKKRSTDNDDVSTKKEDKSKTITDGQTVSTEKNHAVEHDHTYHGKHDEFNSDEEHGTESEEHNEHEHEHDDDNDNNEHDHNDFDDDDDDDDDKKKREIPAAKKRLNLEVIKEDQIISGDLNEVRDKKSIQWSKYFGIDRKKKSDLYHDDNDNNDILEAKKRTSENLLENDNDTKERKDIDPEKLENMNNKLKSIEDYIIDETVKYTGAHQGITDQDEIRNLKDRVVSRLATAYNLEKMRTALEKLRESLDNDNHLQGNEIEFNNNYKQQNEKDKRVAIKKEKVEYDSNNKNNNNDNNQFSSTYSSTTTTNKSQTVPINNLLDTQKDEQKKQKRNELQRQQQYSDSSDGKYLNLHDFDVDEFGAGHFDLSNDNHAMLNGVGGGGVGGNNGGKNFNYNIGNGINDADWNGFSSSQCPILDSITERCQSIDILSGDINQLLLPICNLHQLCYLCGTSQVACDFQYLSEADFICGYNYECQSNVRSALMILRGSAGSQLGIKECLKNPCLYKAIENIGL